MTEHDTIYAALAAAQSEIKPIHKTERADIKSAKGSFSYTYADLGTVLASVMPVLHANGIAATQTTAIADNGAFVLRTSLWHVSGSGVVEGDYLIQCRDMSDPQAVGSAVTYARRYALIAMLCLATEDDDGQRAQQSSPATTSRKAESRRDVEDMLQATTLPASTTTPGRKNAPTPDMWKVNVANTMMIEATDTRKRKLFELGNEAISWRIPSYIIELRDAVDEPTFTAWIEAQAKEKGIGIS